MSKRMKMMALIGVILVAAFMAFMGSGSFAANTDSKNVGVTAAVASTAQLTITSGSPVAYGDLAPVDTPVADTSKVLSLRVNSNKAWNLSVTKGGDLSGGGFNIPSANFKFQGESASTGVTLDVSSYAEFASTPGTQLAHGLRGANRTLDVRYSLLIDWDIQPASYTATHTYTVLNP